MSYEKQTWQTGDTVTSAKLNHMEDGIAAAGGGSALIATNSDGTLNKTAGEIFDAFHAGQMVISRYETVFDGSISVSNNGLLIGAEYEKGDGYYFTFYDGENVTFSASSADDYPAVIDAG